ncbi:amino acid permease [Sporomusa sphaeroides]|uniref:Amino acid permease YhdG n=1 Tax=Sporomusa sphaeroides DSM 2875 TaxID=1337886 RepID=A0ABP2CAM6_9FIRM|nr:amino acid permease [Sporomusa sphaeroides]MCM0758826.1 amino acid permease [Sporomusa sphaeroides DSM 2875]OLS54603.1 putative amino acid permease YhdG [Sporomusa sphaeroides DSM 2875]CVK20866.1 putative amino acid permease YhdG [Sporomusa sphaeroides DSM 2875]
MSIFRTKSIELLKQEASKHSLRKSLTAIDIIMLGIGVIIGTGIFVLTGVAAAKYAGPGLMLSFVLAGITCAFVCLAYSELASMVPIAGSAYTYTYTSLGEFIAWLVGWNLILEYSVGASAVAGGWSAYTVGILKTAGIEVPKALTAVPADGGIVNLPAVLITLFLTFLLVKGVRESANANRILVAIKLAAIFLFIFLAGPKVNAANWEPFLPYGWAGVSAGAAFIFFAYLGVDSIATAAEETHNPSRDMPIGIIGSLAVCTVLYITVTAIMTGVVPYSQLNTAEPVSYVLRSIGYNFGSALVGTGAIAGLSTVLLVMIYAQTRAFFAMSRDGLIPSKVCKVHPKYGTPHIITIIVGVAVALISGFTPIHVVAEMCSIGTLFAFIIAMIGVMVLRKTKPDAERPFRCPSLTFVAVCAILFCLYIMINLATGTWIRFVVWSLIGIAIYFLYGRSHSALNKDSEQSDTKDK